MNELEERVAQTMGRYHGLCTGRRGLAPFACKCGRWSLPVLPDRGRHGSKTLRGRILGVQDMIELHYAQEREALYAKES